MAAAMLQRDWAVAVVLGSALACSSNNQPAPPAPLPSQERGRSEALAPAQDAERAELERAVRSIESAAGLPAPAPLTSEELLQVLEYYCGDCHFPRANSGGHFEGLLLNDLDGLIEQGRIVPGDADGSRLLARIRAGEMPPANSGTPPVPSGTILLIAQYIAGLPPLPSTEPAPPQVAGPPPLPPRPEVPPVQAECFAYLGDWIRCEHEGLEPLRIDIPGRDLERCLQACRDDAACIAVTDYTWLDLPELGCYLYLSSCDTPATGPWHEEDGGRQYLKSCR